MFTTHRCPACGGSGVSLLDTLATDVLVAGYSGNELGIDVAPLFKSVGPMRLCECRACGLKWYADAPAGDTAFYESLQRHDWYYQSDKPEYGFAARLVASGDRVLEVGCGRGAFAAHLPAGVNYRGLEFNQAAVATARAAGLDVEVKPVEQEAQQRPQHYDVVCHFQVLEHVTDPEGFLRACALALRPGGRLIVAVPAENSFIGHAESEWLNMPPHHLTRWSDAALVAAFRRAGVEPQQSWHEQVAPYHRDWQRTVAVRTGWLSLLRRQPSLVRSGGAYRLMRLACRVPGVAQALYARGVTAHPELQQGHCVCVAGTKAA